MIHYTSGYKYQLHKPYHFRLHPAFGDIEIRELFIHVDGTFVTVLRGYAWDGATGVYDSKNSMRGTLEHDATYQLIRLGYYSRDLRKYSDFKLERTLKEDGMWWPRRKLWRKGVKYLAGGAANPKNIRKVKTAGRR